MSKVLASKKHPSGCCLLCIAVTVDTRIYSLHHGFYIIVQNHGALCFANDCMF